MTVNYNYWEYPQFNKAKVIDILLEILSNKLWVVNPKILELTKTNSSGSEEQISLTRLYCHKGVDNNLLKWVISDQLKKDAGVSAFRETSLCSIVLREYMNIVGCQYLQNTLSKVLNEFVQSGVSCEIDEKFVTNKQNKEENLKNLITWSTKILEQILNSLPELPQQIEKLFAILSEEIKVTRPSEADSVIQNAVISFFFLRFLCLAIVNPKQYGLVKESVTDKQTLRNLVLVAKVIQTLANDGEFTSNYSQLGDQMNSYREKMKSFVKNLLTSNNGKKFSYSLSETEIFTHTSTIIKFLNTLDGDKTVNEISKSLMGTDLIKPEDYGTLFDLYGKFLWIINEKSFFTSPESHLTVPSNASRLEKIMNSIDHMIYSSKPASSPYSYSNISDWFDDELKKNKFLVIVAYRGGWCLFCKKYMSSWNSFVSAIKLKGGAIYGLSSETPELAAQAKEKWSLNYDLIGDPANSISEFYNVAIDRSPFALSRGISNGMTQPGILVVSQSREIWYYWTSSPSIDNGFGARSRPKPVDVFYTILNNTEDDEVNHINDVNSQKLSVPQISLSRTSSNFDSSSFPSSLSKSSSNEDISKSLVGGNFMEAFDKLTDVNKKKIIEQMLQNERTSMMMYESIRPKKKQIKAFIKQEKKKITKSTSKNSSQSSTSGADCEVCKN